MLCRFSSLFALAIGCLALGRSTALKQEFCEVMGYQMAYMEAQGAGEDTLIFLHGNPTSSYLWRNIMPELESRGRLIAPDLIGMGASDKLNNSGVDSYRFVEHADFLDGLLDCVLAEDEDVILVLHDWGGGLGFYWGMRNPERVKGIVYMETITEPWEFSYFPPTFEQFFVPLRTPGVGEELVLENNFFVETIDANVIRNLTEDELAAYRAPYLEPGEGRRPTLTWPREVPIGGEPADVTEIVTMYAEWMASNVPPKLLIVAEPGVIFTEGSILLENVRMYRNQTEVTVPGLHFLQEDSPQEISDAINDWMDDVFLQQDDTMPVPAPTMVPDDRAPTVPPVATDPTPTDAPTSSATFIFVSGSAMLLFLTAHQLVI